MKNTLADHYRGKKVFLTGHTGFKGAWLAAWLRLFNANVKGYALAPSYEHGLYQVLANSAWTVQESIIGDIRDKEKLREAMLAFQPDIVFHLAAQPLVRRSYEIPAETFDVNVTGTANLLEIIKDLPGKCEAVVVTTDKVYDNKENGALYTEDDQLGGYDPYSASKACAELVINAFRNSFFHPGQYASHHKTLVAARAGNVIGGGDWSEDRLIPDIVRALSAKADILVRNPASVRPWQHVLDPLAGYLLLAQRLQAGPAGYSTAYNFGPRPADHLTVKELVQQAISSWGGGQWQDVSDPGQPHEAKLLQLDISRAGKELAWTPRLNSTQAIAWTMDWYRRPATEQAAFAVQQIKDYMEL